MTRTGEFVTGTIIVTAIGETSRTHNNENVPQWSLDCTPPWTSQYPLKLWIDVGRFEKPAIGPVRVMLKVGRLVKDTYDGNMPWMWRYFVEEMPYTGPDLTTSSQPSQDARTEAQQGGQAQGATVDWNRRAVEIKWGQAVNLAASSMPPTGDGPQFDKELDMLWSRAKYIFPHLFAWEKEAVDSYLEQSPSPGTESQWSDMRDREPVDFSASADDAKFFAQKQEQASSGDADFDAIPSASGTQSKLPSTGPSGTKRVEWDYNDFAQAAAALKASGDEMAGAFGYTVGATTVHNGVRNWVLETGKSFEDALAHLKECMVGTV